MWFTKVVKHELTRSVQASRIVYIMLRESRNNRYENCDSDATVRFRAVRRESGLDNEHIRLALAMVYPVNYPGHTPPHKHRRDEAARLVVTRHGLTLIFPLQVENSIVNRLRLVALTNPG